MRARGISRLFCRFAPLLAALSRAVGTSHANSISPADLPARSAAPPGAARKAFAGIAAVTAMLIGVAIWNGFPLVFYDTGAYLAQGLQGAFMVERSPVYSLFLAATGSAISLWPVAILQSALTAYVLWEVAHLEVPGLTLNGFCAIGLGLSLATGIGWYTAQIEPDCMTALAVLGAYLLLFRTQALGRRRGGVIVAITALAIACHPSHLGLYAGLLICGLGCKILFSYRRPALALVFPPVRLLPAFVALLLALAMTLASNFALTRSLFISRSGSVFVFARLMQDGIVKKVLDDSCTGPATPYRLCAYRNRLATSAAGWLWGNNPGFKAQGGFKGGQDEDQRIIVESLKRYPLLHLRAAIYDSALQFFMFKTGDGIESQERILRPEISLMMPQLLHAYLEARQQHNRIEFRELNMLHVTIGMLSLLGVLLLLYHAGLERRWDRAVLPSLVVLALVGNAIICGTFSNPHDRYQSRLIWLPALVVLLALARDPRALQPAEEAG
jgi:hypothetical protein